MSFENKKVELMDKIILSELYKTNNKSNSFSMAIDLLGSIMKSLTNENIKLIPKINDEYQCSHVKENILSSNCVFCNLTVVEQGLEKQKKKTEELQTVLDAWFEIFETNQLTHAIDRLRVAEAKAEKYDNLINKE